MEYVQIASIIGAALAVSFGAIGPALGEGRAVAAAMDAIARQPEAEGTLSRTLFIFILTANWSSLVPGVEPPTAYLETDAALALIVFVATIYFGIRSNGLGGYLKNFARPSWVMIPLNLVEQVTRAFSMMVRLFGNVMSGVFVIGIVLSLTGLLVPIPLMALDLLTGAIQAYIFAVLATVFIAASVSEGGEANRSNERKPCWNMSR